jgi:signal transduction histidine kinase
MTRLQNPVMDKSSSVNHEFNNALASVKCLTELLTAYPGLENDDRMRFLDIMRQETQRMERLARVCQSPADRGSF